MEIANIVEYTVAGVYVLVSAIALIVSWVQSIKDKNKARQKELANKTAQEIDATARDLIETAETFKNYTGVEKLNWVITRLKQLNQNLYGEDELISLVNSIVKTTKNVNNENNEGGANGGK